MRNSRRAMLVLSALAFPVGNAGQAASCLPNQIRVAEGLCENVGGTESSNLKPFDLDALVGANLDADSATELEAVEEDIDVYQPNSATKLKIECPTEVYCRQMKASGPKDACPILENVWTGIPMLLSNTWTTSMENFPIVEDMTPRTIQLDRVSFVDLRAKSHTCVHLENEISAHIGGHSTSALEPGSKLSIISSGGSKIRTLFGFPGELSVEKVKTIKMLSIGSYPNANTMRGVIRIVGPTSIEMIHLIGDMYFEEVEAGTVVLEGRLHVKNTSIEKLFWKMARDRFFLGSCEKGKGCKGRVKFLPPAEFP